jgi:hypothetical protein
MKSSEYNDSCLGLYGFDKIKGDLNPFVICWKTSSIVTAKPIYCWHCFKVNSEWQLLGKTLKLLIFSGATLREAKYVTGVNACDGFSQQRELMIND